MKGRVWRIALFFGLVFFTLGAECDFSGIVEAICAQNPNHPSCPPSHLLVFVTSSNQSPNMGGLEGADAICKNLADESPLAGRHWRAWLSTSDVDAVSRLEEPGHAGFVRPDGEEVARSIADLTDGSIANPIQIDQHDGNAGNTSVWTATGADGTLTNSNNTCGDWTSTANASGDRGFTGDTGGSWTSGGSFNCSIFTARIYCFEIEGP